MRSADDRVVLCCTAGEAHAALAEVGAWVTEAGLTLHPEKTHVGNCLEAGQGFDFLGYRFEGGQRWVRKLASSVRERNHLVGASHPGE